MSKTSNRRIQIIFAAIVFLVFGMMRSAHLPSAQAGAPGFAIDVHQVDNSTGGAALDGYVSNDLKLTNNGQTLGLQLALVLTQGTIYQDPFGSNLPPSRALLESGIAPSVEFDSYIALGVSAEGDPLPFSGPIGGAVDLELARQQFGADASRVLFDEHRINIAWSAQPGNEVFDLRESLAARISLSADAKGQWSFLTSGIPIFVEKRFITQAVGMVGIPHHPGGYDPERHFNFSDGLGIIENGAMRFAPAQPETNAYFLEPRPLSYVPPGPDAPKPQTLSIVPVDNSAGGAALDGYLTFDILTSFEGQYTASEISLDVGEQNIFQGRRGSQFPPTAAQVEANPELAFDTFVAQGSPLRDGPSGDPSLPPYGAVALCESSRQEFSISRLNTSFYPSQQVIINQDDFLLARVSFRENAEGFLSIFSSVNGVDSIFRYSVSPGGIIERIDTGIPEPCACTLCLFGLLIWVSRLQ